MPTSRAAWSHAFRFLRLGESGQPPGVEARQWRRIHQNYALVETPQFVVETAGLDEMPEGADPHVAVLLYLQPA
jgi:hypothetical protein